MAINGLTESTVKMDLSPRIVPSVSASTGMDSIRIMDTIVTP